MNCVQALAVAVAALAATGEPLTPMLARAQHAVAEIAAEGETLSRQALDLAQAQLASLHGGWADIAACGSDASVPDRRIHAIAGAQI